MTDICELLVVFLRATERLADQKNLCVHVMTVAHVTVEGLTNHLIVL